MGETDDEDLPIPEGAEMIVLRETAEERALVCLALGMRFWKPRLRKLILITEIGPVADHTLKL